MRMAHWARKIRNSGSIDTLVRREGNRGPGAAPQNVYRCRGVDRWLALAIETDRQWHGLRRVLGDPGWAREASLATAAFFAASCCRSSP